MPQAFPTTCSRVCLAWPRAMRSYIFCRKSAASQPCSLRWQRENLLDSMLDAHFYYSGASAVVALEPDHMLSTAAWLEEMGVELEAANYTLQHARTAKDRTGSLDR